MVRVRVLSPHCSSVCLYCATWCTVLCSSNNGRKFVVLFCFSWCGRVHGGAAAAAAAARASVRQTLSPPGHLFLGSTLLLYRVLCAYIQILHITTVCLSLSFSHVTGEYSTLTLQDESATCINCIRSLFEPRVGYYYYRYYHYYHYCHCILLLPGMYGALVQ